MPNQSRQIAGGARLDCDKHRPHKRPRKRTVVINKPAPAPRKLSRRRYLHAARSSERSALEAPIRRAALVREWQDIEQYQQRTHQSDRRLADLASILADLLFVPVPRQPRPVATNSSDASNQGSTHVHVSHSS